MNFSYGIIAAVGILIAISVGLIVDSPDSIIEPRVLPEDKPQFKTFPTSLTISIPKGTGTPGCEMTNQCYIPYEVTVAQGATVTWKNDDSAAHTVTSGTPAEGHDGLFDSSLFIATTTYEFTFDETGTFDYFCMVHPWMVGVLNVSESPVIVEETMMIEEPVMEEETMMIEEHVMEEETMMIEEPVMEEETMMIEEPVMEEEVIIEETEMVEQTSDLPMAVTVSLPEGSGVPGCEATNECYIPYEVTVAQGATVTWSNDDSAAHTVTSGTPAEGHDGLFDSSLFMAGTIYEFTFDETGTFDYFCMVHPWMVGVVSVSESSTMNSVMIEEPVMEEEVIIEETEMVEQTSDLPMAVTVSLPEGSGVPGCEATNECYIPYEVTVAQGATVTWSNDDSAAHTVTSGTVDAGVTSVFDSGLFMAGTIYEFTFDETGTFDYFCMVHPWMTGIVNVN